MTNSKLKKPFIRYRMASGSHALAYPKDGWTWAEAAYNFQNPTYDLKLMFYIHIGIERRDDGTKQSTTGSH